MAASSSSCIGGKWTPEEDARLREVVTEHGAKNWKSISKIAFNGSRSDVQCLHRWQKVLRPGLVKGPWLATEDQVIVEMINTHGIGNIKWSEIAAALPGRLGKQCRERWVNHLDPDLKKEPWSEEEDRILMEKQVELGNKWRDIAAFLPGRSENSVKNRWNSTKRKSNKAQENSTKVSSPSAVKTKRSKAAAPSTAPTGAKKKQKLSVPKLTTLGRSKKSENEQDNGLPTLSSPLGQIETSFTPTNASLASVNGIQGFYDRLEGTTSPGWFPNSDLGGFSSLAVNNNGTSIDWEGRSSTTSPAPLSSVLEGFLSQRGKNTGEPPSPAYSPFVSSFKEAFDDKESKSSMNNIDFAMQDPSDLVVVGKKLTEKQKKDLKDSNARTDDKSFFKSEANKDLRTPKSLTAGGNGEFEDIFTIFTFDDLVDDMVA